MRLESIKVQNLRQLKDLTLKFNKIRGKNDIHVILAENGVGKTNIMNAITWCLYDKESHLRNEDTALSIINSKVLEETRKSGGGLITVSVELEFSIGKANDTISFTKTVKFRVPKDKDDDIFTIMDDMAVTILEGGGHRIIDDDEEVMQIIHKYLPEEINSYIFFDGEQLEEFFSYDQTEKVRQGINDLTQASYLERATTYLDKYIRTEILDKIKGAGDKELEEKQNNYDRICNEVETSASTIDQFTRQIDDSKNQIDELARIIRGNEIVPEKIRALDDTILGINKLQQELKEKNDKLMMFTRENYFLLSLYPSLKNFGDFIQEKDKEGSLPPRIDKKFYKRYYRASIALYATPIILPKLILIL